MRKVKIYQFLIVFFLLHVFFISTAFATTTRVSLKKGVGISWQDIWPPRDCGQSPHPLACKSRLKNGLATLGVSWFYCWARPEFYFDYFDGDFEFVPMVWGAGSNGDRSYTQQELDDFATIAQNHPGSYWLIWNEPDLGGQANITAAVAAGIYKPLRKAIKDADPNAKMIIGGMSSDPEVWVSWAREFRANFSNPNNKYEGWHVHLYACGTAYDVTTWRQTIKDYRHWINANGGGELWLTEFGCLSQDEPRIIQDQLDWMETYSGIDRYAWFYAGTGGFTNMRANLFNGYLPSSPSFGLSSMGEIYARFPLHPNPTPTLPPSSPTPSVIPCLGGDLGNLDCDSGGLINTFDLSILLGSWVPFGPVPTPVPGHWTSDISPDGGDGRVDSGDLSKLLSNWRTTP